jgi:H+-transporting ATPase
MPNGLSSSEAKIRLEQYGPNSLPEERQQPLLSLLKKFWGPVPWMLELSLGLELVIGRYTQAIIIALLLIFNAIIAFFQENNAQNALKILQKKLSIRARVLRDERWQTLPADELVPGDIIHLRPGDMIPADVLITQGNLSIDQSSLTGESLPVEASENGAVYAGGIIQHGEADGQVTATGSKTYFGKTAELVRVAKATSHLEATILSMVKYLVLMDLILVIGVLLYSGINNFPWSESIPFALMLLIASIPVALPAMFTLTSALGAQELAKNGVLVTRLSAIEEAAGMDILCSDKTGTVTQNQIELAAIEPIAPFSVNELLRYGFLGSDEASQDPIDLTIIRAAQQQAIKVEDEQRSRFIPFDPATKYTEAIWETSSGEIHVIKGLPQVVDGLIAHQKEILSKTETLAEKGYRVIAVAAGPADNLQPIGLLGLYDPPRPDSESLIKNLQALAVRVVMITGDSLATAKAVAAQVGLGSHTCTAEKIRTDRSGENLSCDVVAGVLPEDKYHLVQQFQEARHVVGMTGDGVNDAPALKQAEVGIAVSNATDVARAAASIVLTNPGLVDILTAVKIGRQIYQRLLTYSLNKIVKTFQIALFLSLGLFATGFFVTTPRLVILLIFANDFVTMSLASDRVKYSKKPDRWDLKPMIISSLALAIAWLIFSFVILLLGLNTFHLNQAQIQTSVFVMLVFTGQANVYLVRAQDHFWRSRPGTALLWSTIGDLFVVTILATRGILMTAIPLYLTGLIILSTIIFMIGLDFFKVLVYKNLGFRS